MSMNCKIVNVALCVKSLLTGIHPMESLRPNGFFGCTFWVYIFFYQNIIEICILFSNKYWVWQIILYYMSNILQKFANLNES